MLTQFKGLEVRVNRLSHSRAHAVAPRGVGRYGGVAARQHLARAWNLHCSWLRAGLDFRVWGLGFERHRKISTFFGEIEVAWILH